MASLVKKLDAAVAKAGKKKMAAIVVFCSADDELPAKIKELAEKEKIENVSFGISKPEGPYKKDAAVHKDADVTVILYTSRNVKVNHAFKKGEFTAASVDKVLDDLPKILKK